MILKYNISKHLIFHKFIIFWAFEGHVPSELVKLTVSLNEIEVDELTQIIHSSRAQTVGRCLVEKLQTEIPKQLFRVAIQAKVGSKVIARETLKPIKRDVVQHVVIYLKKTSLLKEV